MIHGKEKVRDMTRSLLPSKHRAAARFERAVIHRSARRHSHMEMARLTRDPESFEDLGEIDEAIKGDLDVMVWSRRESDKVAPFVRWARAITRSLPQEHRMEHVRSLVPPGVIGDHALFHVSAKRELQHPAELAYHEAQRQRWARSRNPPWLERGEQAGLLRALLLAPGGHRAFNRWLRVTFVPQYRSERRRRACSCEPGCFVLETVSIPVEPVRPRMLRGVHDVRPFLEALWGSSPRHDRWSSPVGPHADQAAPVDTFLRAFKEHRWDVAATVKVLRLEQRMNGFTTWRGRPSP